MTVEGDKCIMMADRGRGVIEHLDDDEAGLSFEERVDRLSIEDELLQLMDQQIDT